MYLSVNKEPKPEITPATAISKSEAWELASIGLGLLDSGLQIKFCNTYLQTLLASSEHDLTGKNFLQHLDIDNQLRTHISSELTEQQSWQGIIHKANHELRTPLNATLGFAQLVNTESDLSDQQHDHLKAIEDAGNYLLKLSTEILDLSKIESGKIKLSEDTVCLEQLLAECLALVKPIAERKTIHIECVLTIERQLHTDLVRLKQVILNLLSNAINYNSENGLVVVYCYDVNDRNIRIEIQDSGPGIAPELLGNIFAPFERAGADDRNIAGRGIGLMIARRLTQLMGGKIDVLSEPQHGSLFWLELPAINPDAMEFQYFDAVAASRVSFNTEPNKVIYIGENAGFAALLQRLLSIRENLQLQTFTDFIEARVGLTRMSKACVFVSEKIACDLAQDANSIHLSWNLSLIVVKDKNYCEINPSYSPAVKAQLPDSFKFTDILKIIDNSFLDGF